ncbi:two-component system sensor histidine kinase YesM [Paenibacillus taihuensis]|uniref:Two-component system sensor histidine kinase YesM n=1 Tax=Paenibacillus taihuensis TaxID=1156355 RepID=A0A3D9QTF8_9BACL|nr:histidine kinase [Paenibacillus taihuensis]REE66659.1 two-component system sensor histidine kinase YesM [Paenibacillus taihuensis]
MSPIMILYTYSNKESVDVIREQIDFANESRLSNYLNQLESTVDQLAYFAAIVMNDSDVLAFAESYPKNGFDRYATQRNILDKLTMFSSSFSNKWNNRVTVFFPRSQAVVSTYSPYFYHSEELQEKARRGARNWYFDSVQEGSVTKSIFSRLFLKSAYSAENVLESPYVIEIDLYADNIVSLLDQFKNKGINDPFFYQSPINRILNSSSDTTLSDVIATRLSQQGEASDPFVVDYEGRQFQVYTKHSDEMGWTLVDYVPMKDILKPVTKSTQLFYSIVSLLILVALSAAGLLYFHIQVPVRQLIRGVQYFKNGQYSARLREKTNNDFQLLFSRFNQMTAEIQQLIEQVHAEEIRSREAVMKQLQSQINPHFLYNCFAFIISMAKMKRYETIVAIGHNLADYYKYSTHNEILVSSLQEELAFVHNYLDIMNMQLDKFSYEIEINSEMEGMRIPKLLIQPIVENAIVHGLEPKLERGMIRIRGTVLQEVCSITVEDDGAGFAGHEAGIIQQMPGREYADSGGTGMKNVAQRLNYFFGEGSGLDIGQSELGGAYVKLYWSIHEHH